MVIFSHGFIHLKDRHMYAHKSTDTWVHAQTSSYSLNMHMPVDTPRTYTYQLTSLESVHTSWHTSSYSHNTTPAINIPRTCTYHFMFWEHVPTSLYSHNMHLRSLPEHAQTSWCSPTQVSYTYADPCFLLFPYSLLTMMNFPCCCILLLYSHFCFTNMLKITFNQPEINKSKHLYNKVHMMKPMNSVSSL